MLPWIVGQPAGQCKSPQMPWDNTDQQMICWDHVAYAHWSVLLDPTLWRLQYILQLLECMQVSMLLAVPKTIVATWVSSITCPVVGLLVVVLNMSISTNGRILYSAWPIHQGVPSERWDEPHALVNELTLLALSSIWWTSSTPSHPHLPRAPFSNSTTGAHASSTTQENLCHDGWVTNLISAVVCEYWPSGQDVTADNMEEQWPFKCITKCNSSQSLTSPLGITSQDFQKLFVKCDQCGYIVARHVFVAHDCDLIDLTGDTDLE